MARRRPGCRFCHAKTEPNYTNPALLATFLGNGGRIEGRGKTKLCRRHQSRLARAVKRAREMALLATWSTREIEWPPREKKRRTKA